MGSCVSSCESELAPGTQIEFNVKCEGQATDVPLDFVLPAEGATDLVERKRFMTGVTVIDTHEDEEAVIIPRKDTAFSLAARKLSADTPRHRTLSAVTSVHGTSTVGKDASPKDKEDSLERRESPEDDEGKHETRAFRIATAMDVYALETWWGVGPSSPDRRLAAAMPGHALATDVVQVLVRKTDRIERLLDELCLDDVCDVGAKYVLWQMKFGKMCLLSLHRVTDDDAYERILLAQGGDLLKDSLKLIVTPVNLQLSIPAKGPKEADTVGSFFGRKNVSFSRPGDHPCKFDISMISVDLYSVWSLKFLLPSVAFKQGRMADYHLVSYNDNAVLASYRAAVTPELIDLMKAC